MVNKTESDERRYLQKIILKLEDAYRLVDKNVARYVKELQEQKSYLYENKTGMDAAEKASVKQSVTMQAISGEAAEAYKKRILKLIETPYFGRVDFKEKGKLKADPVYIGIHAFFDEEENENLIHDWRAPVSSMFYDFEPGQASFEAPSGKKEGQIERKRQYRIQNGDMEMMIESELYIRDDVLQKELSRSADDKMKNIVATIQRDQNRIIRDETSKVLIIQGVAGSGKTSIALHRIAFLLYRFKETLNSKDIMIISPNRVFSDYISNVLPELGEDTIPEMGMEALADYVLNRKIRYQSFFEQVNELLENHDSDYIARIEFKASAAFLTKLIAYTNWLKRERFIETDIKIRYKTIKANTLRTIYNANNTVPLNKRATIIATEVIKKAQNEFGYHLKNEEKNEIKKIVKNMMGSDNIRVLYKEFYDWLEKPEMFRYAKGSVYEYADVFPLIFLKMQLEGAESFKHVKHIIVDEMQDYTAVQYAVLNRLFLCNKTILGDANQNVNPYSSTTAEDIKNVLSDAQDVTLTKSYRSTYEITKFSLRISPRADVEAVERHGEEPEICSFENSRDEKKAILGYINDYSATDWNSLGILCKTQKQAKTLHKYISKYRDDIVLLSPGSSSLDAGIVITSAHLAKGLEFDQVIVPQVSTENYHSEVDRSMLYIACTRAMHKLTLTHTGQKSRLIKK